MEDIAPRDEEDASVTVKPAPRKDAPTKRAAPGLRAVSVFIRHYCSVIVFTQCTLVLRAVPVCLDTICSGATVFV